MPFVRPVVKAILPGAGLSSRMGMSKLLLPWKGRTLLEHMVDIYLRGGASEVVVVTREETAQALAGRLPPQCQFVIPIPPPKDMRESLIAGFHSPEIDGRTPRGTLVGPTDLPGLPSEVISRLLARWGEFAQANEADQIILAPQVSGRSRHPVLLGSGAMVEFVHDPEAPTLRDFLSRKIVSGVDCNDLVAKDPSAFADLDTPDDWNQFQRDS